MKKIAVGFFILLIIFSVLSAQVTFGNVKIKLNSIFIDNGVKARIVNISKNRIGTVDFYARMAKGYSTVEEFQIEMAFVIGAIGGFTREVAWKTNRLYFHHVVTNKLTGWISTYDCRRK